MQHSRNYFPAIKRGFINPHSIQGRAKKFIFLNFIGYIDGVCFAIHDLK